jgi:ribonuclease HI
MGEPTPPATYLFADGACSGNGFAHAQAAFAVFGLTGVFKGAHLSGRVASTTYRLVKPDDPSRGFEPTGEPSPVSNNRAEYLAVAYALLLLLQAGETGKLRVVSDSKLALLTLTDWLPTRRAKGTVAALKNRDLVEIMEALYSALSARAVELQLVHVHSHRKRPPAGTPLLERACWYGNYRADSLASAAVAERGTPPALGTPEEISATGAMRAAVARA